MFKRVFEKKPKTNKLAVFDYQSYFAEIVGAYSRQQYTKEMIPNDITSLIATNMHPIEYFDNTGSHLAIKDNGNELISIDGYEPHTAFCKFKISSKESNCVYKWYFELIFQNSMLTFGIASTNFDSKNEAFHLNHSSHNYAYNCYSGNKVSNSAYSHYGKSCKSGSTIVMELDFTKPKKIQLSYTINGESQGVAFDNIKHGNNIEYRACVAMRGQGTYNTSEGRNKLRLQKFEKWVFA